MFLLLHSIKIFLYQLVLLSSITLLKQEDASNPQLLQCITSLEDSLRKRLLIAAFPRAPCNQIVLLLYSTSCNRPQLHKIILHLLFYWTALPKPKATSVLNAPPLYSTLTMQSFSIFFLNCSSIKTY